MLERAAAFLKALGIPTEPEEKLLSYILENEVQTILNETNQEQVPEGLENVLVYRTAGRYLKLKKDTGQLKGFDLDAAVSQIQEGDTSVTFAVGTGSLTPEQRLDNTIASLLEAGAHQMTAYRRLKW